MALQQSFSDQYGATHEKAYWRLDGFEVYKSEGKAVLHMRAWVNAQAASDGKPSIALRSYTLPAALFAAAMDALTKPASSDSEVSLAQTAYQYVKGLKDIDTGEKDGDGQPVLISYFAGAIDV